MTRPSPDWAYMTDETGSHWFHLSNGQKKPPEEKGFRPPSKALYAIPTNDVISVPQWVSSKDSSIIEEAVSMEVERLGVRREDGPGKVSDWKTVELNGSRTLVQSVSIPWNLPELDSLGDVFSDFVPQYDLYTPPEDSIVLWTEDSIWVAGYSRGNQWAHVQTLGNGTPEEITSEIQLTLLELSAKGVVESLNHVVVWGDLDVSLYKALEEGLGREVTFESRPQPSSRSSDWRLMPHSVTENRLEDARKRRGVMFASIAILALSLLVGAAFIHLWFLEQSNSQLRNRIVENRESADEIQASIDRWYALSPAVSPERSPLDIFYEIAALLPEKGFRFTSFDLQNSTTVIVRGEGSTMANALKIKAAIEEAPGLADFVWEIPPPITKGGITEIVATGTYQFAGNEEE